jgi:hypothetical protein
MKKWLLVILSSLFLIGCSCVTKTDNYTLEQIQLKSNNVMSGTFFLGCGNINSNEQSEYYFYTNSNGAINLRRVYYKYVTIYYTKEKPKAIYKENSGCCDSFQPIWEVYIPEGSIVNNYDVNIK